MSKRILVKVDYSTYLSLPLKAAQILEQAEIVESDGYGDEIIFRRKEAAREMLLIHEHLIKDPAPAAPKAPLQHEEEEPL